MTVAIVVEPLSRKHVPAVRQFNKRIEAGGVGYCFPESSVPQWLPRRESIPLYQEHFVALEEGNTVRGAYILKRQPFACNGEVTTIADYQLPISEGTIDSSYALVGLLMLKDALKREPQLFALGIGGYQEAIARMLKVMKWRMVSCPFFFKVTHPFRFFREIAFLRKRRFMGIVLDHLAFSGMGWVVIKSMQFIRQRPRATDIRAEEVDSFSRWSDDIWQQIKDRYAFVAVRDSTILNTLYPAGDTRFKRIKVLRQDKAIGWAVVLNTKMVGDKYFGDMRVGTVVDCLAAEGEEAGVVTMATRCLERSGVDIIVTNQLHRSWCQAFSRNGYLVGPSNFIFAVSPLLAKRLHPFHTAVAEVHITRGDGDGPTHLLTGAQ